VGYREWRDECAARTSMAALAFTLKKDTGVGRGLEEKMRGEYFYYEMLIDHSGYGESLPCLQSTVAGPLSRPDANLLPQTPGNHPRSDVCSGTNRGTLEA